MKFDFTITIAVILALSAIISPIIVSIINNHYQLKLKRFENYELSKVKALETFTQYSGNYIASCTDSSYINFMNSLYGLLPYFKISNNDLNKFNKITNKSDVSSNIQNLTVKLSEQIKPMHQLSVKNKIRKPKSITKN